jgi:hypothetical protein
MSTDQSTTVHLNIEYRTIERFPAYRFGSDGSIWSDKNPNKPRKLKTYVSKENGYFYICFCFNGNSKKYILHRLICEAFHGPCPEGMECRHSPDSNKSNCNYNNLKWGTRIENEHDKIADGTRNTGERNGESKLKNFQIPIIRKMLNEGKTKTEISKIFSISRSVIRKIEAKEIWNHVL